MERTEPPPRNASCSGPNAAVAVAAVVVGGLRETRMGRYG